MKRDVQQYNIERKEFEKEMDNDGGNRRGMIVRLRRKELYINVKRF